jgi:DNA-binding NarL/FixJ family response regulator
MVNTFTTVVGSIPALATGWVQLLCQNACHARTANDALASVDEGNDEAVLLIVDSIAELERVTDLRRRGFDGPLVVLLPRTQVDTDIIWIKAGADGVATWKSSPQEVIGMLECAKYGRVSLARQAVLDVVTSAILRRPELTATEHTLLVGLVTGVPITALADRIKYSERETYRRLRALYQKLGVRNRSEAIAIASRTGIVDF